jgi:hypothetical protein
VQALSGSPWRLFDALCGPSLGPPGGQKDRGAPDRQDGVTFVTGRTVLYGKFTTATLTGVLATVVPAASVATLCNS